MLDIRFIRENPDLVAEKSRQKGYKVSIPHLLEVDNQRRKLLEEIEKLRAARNEHAEMLAKQGGPGPTSPENVQKGRDLKQQITQLGEQLEPIEKEFWRLLKAVPNMPIEDVPVGTTVDENVVTKEWGDKSHFDFEPKTHWEITEPRDLIDKFHAANVTGSRFAYIKGDLVRLQFAILQFTLDKLTDNEMIQRIIQNLGLKNVSTKPFIPVLPPAMIREEIFDAMDRLEPKEDRYQVGPQEDKLWLQGSAEHTLGPIHMDEFLPEEKLPIRYLGYLTSFRREAGTYGKDTEGIIRMHQFDKLEMESFTLPENGINEHRFMIAVQEHLMQELKLPYRVLKKCTIDIGKPNASGVDIEAWLPGDKRYLETHTADYMTDYQARRLAIKAKKQDGNIVLIHTNDATVFAMGRTLVAIIENYQNQDGTIRVPEVLKPYMRGQSSL